MLKITHFSVENSYVGTGVFASRPRFSWKLESDKNDTFQTAYKIDIAGLCEGEKIYSAQSVWADYAGTPLAPATEYTAKLTVWDNHGQSATSELAFETTLFDCGFKGAQFIAADLGYNSDCAVLFKKVTLKSRPQRARAYVSALGMYELSVNGQKAGDAFFAPGWTDYRRTLQYQTYDITALLCEGENIIEIEVAKGWYRARLADYGNNLYGNKNAAISEIRIDGDVINTDKTWSSRKSNVVMSELYDGETCDCTLDTSQIFPVQIVEFDKSRLANQIGPSCHAVSELGVVRKIITPKGEHVLDFGQNAAGVVRFKVNGLRGQRVTLRYAEVLDDEGNFYTGNLRTAKSTDTFILSGGEQVLNARFTYHGFRYVRVEGMEARAEDFTFLVISSDLPQTGRISSSDGDIERLARNILWTQRSNFVDVPTDCPQRDERLGWTGDIAAFCETAAVNSGCSAFLNKWLRDMRGAQGEDGDIPIIIPPPAPVCGTSAIWADSVTIVPWAVYLEYGDKRLLKEQFPAMLKYLAKQRSLKGATGLIKSGHQFGDWLALDADPAVDGKRGATDVYFIANAYWANSLFIAAQTARILGEEEGCESLLRERDELIAAIRREFFTPNGRMVSETQTACVLALKFGIVPEEHKDVVISTLRRCVEKRKGHLSTGFAATQYLLQTLTKYGLEEQAQSIFLNRTCPGWLYEVEKGATTVWERWNAILPDGTLFEPEMNSFNHYASASVGAYLYRTVAGIEQTEAGYKSFSVRPHPLKGVKEFSAEIDSVYGSICSGYKTKNGKIIFTVKVPANTSATIFLPDGTSRTVGSGNYTFECEGGDYGVKQVYTLESRLCDFMADERVVEVASKIAPQMFGGQSGASLSSLKLSFGQLVSMSDEKAGEMLKGLLKEVNKKLGEN